MQHRNKTTTRAGIRAEAHTSTALLMEFLDAMPILPVGEQRQAKERMYQQVENSFAAQAQEMTAGEVIERLQQYGDAESRADAAVVWGYIRTLRKRHPQAAQAVADWSDEVMDTPHPADEKLHERGPVDHLAAELRSMIDQEPQK